MNSDGFIRRSFRKSKKKRKDGSEEVPNKKASSTNFALALSETERVAADNRRLKHELEFERSRNNYHGNDFRFPPRAGSVSMATQTEVENGEFDNLLCKNQILEGEAEVMKNRIRALEHQFGKCQTVRSFDDEKHIFEKIKEELKRQNESLQKEMQNLRAQFLSILKVDATQGKCCTSTSQDPRQGTEGTRNSEISSNRDNIENSRPSGSDGGMTERNDNSASSGEGYRADDRSREELRELKDLMVKCKEDWSSRLEHMENTLAQEMRSRYADTGKSDTPSIPDKPEVLKMPRNIREFGWKLQSYMVTRDKVRHLFRALNVNSLDVEVLTSKLGVSPRDQFWSLLCFWFKENRRLATIEDLQQACLDVDIGILKNGCMPKEHRLLLEKLYSFIEEHLLPAVTLPYLRDNGLLDNSDVFHVTSQCTKPERCASLLSLLPLFGEHALESFCEALIKSDQSHIEKTIREHQSQNEEPMVEEITEQPSVRKSGQRVNIGTGRTARPFDDPNVNGGQLDILKLLASIWTTSNHVEAMMMDMSGGSNSSSLARSDRGPYDCVSWNRSNGRCSIDSGSNTSTLARSDLGSNGSTLTRSGRIHAYTGNNATSLA